VAGGFGPGDHTGSSVERYDIRGRRWRRVLPMPVALNQPAAVAYRGRLLFALKGGVVPWFSPSPTIEFLGETTR
jgi:hypothetical protein